MASAARGWCCVEAVEVEVGVAVAPAHDDEATVGEEGEVVLKSRYLVSVSVKTRRVLPVWASAK